MNRRLALPDLEHEVSVAGSVDSVAVPLPVVVAVITVAGSIAVAVITKPK